MTSPLLTAGVAIGTIAPEAERVAIIRLAIDRNIAEIDRIISDQVDAVMRHPRLRKLEASWRGLRQLINVADSSDDVKVKLLQARWQELCHDFEKSVTFDASVLFQKIYEQEFGMAGGEPFGLLLGDYEVAHAPFQDHRTDDVAALGGLARVATAAFAPFVANASATLFGLESFRDLSPSVGPISADRNGAIGISPPTYLRDIAHEPQYQRWRGLRAREEARFLALTLPACLIREPEDELTAASPFRGRLSREASGPQDFLFTSGVYAFGSIVISSYARSGWFADIRGARRGADGGGLAPDLPSPPFPTDKPDVARRTPVEIQIDFMQERALDELGIIPLAPATGAPEILIRSSPSLYRVTGIGASGARHNSVLSAMFQYVLCVSRFAHYLKVFGRELVGARITAAECEKILGGWIRDYTTSDDNARPEMLAKRPLREARIEVRDNPAVSGGFVCRAWLKPHFLPDRLISAFEITTELGGPGAVGDPA